MRMKAVYCFLVLLVGCAQVPRPSTYPYTFQQQMQAAHHWQVLANQVAGETAAVLKGELGSMMEPIYIQSDYRTSTDNTPCADRTPYKNTPFAQAFNSFLITELTKQGVPISFNQDNRLQICWAVQPLVHRADRIKPPFPLETTLLAGLGFGLAETWYQLSPGAAGAVTAFGVGPILDTLRGLRTGPLPHSEIIITTTITDRGVILAPNARNAYVFYINDKDWQHYWSVPDTPQKSYTVVGR